LWIGTVVGVNGDCEPGNWPVRRELELAIGKSWPLWIHGLSLRVGLSCREVKCNKEPMVGWNILLLHPVGGLFSQKDKYT
jgi:hypothetical protein